MQKRMKLLDKIVWRLTTKFVSHKCGVEQEFLTLQTYQRKGDRSERPSVVSPPAF